MNLQLPSIAFVTPLAETPAVGPSNFHQATGPSKLRVAEPLQALIALFFRFMKLRHPGQVSRLRPARSQKRADQ